MWKRAGKRTAHWLSACKISGTRVKKNVPKSATNVLLGGEMQKKALKNIFLLKGDMVYVLNFL